MSLSPGKIHYTREASARAFPPFAPPPPLRSSRARKSVLAVEKNAKYRGEFAGIIHTGARGKMPRINRGQETLSLSLGSPARYGGYTLYFHIRAQRATCSCHDDDAAAQMRSTSLPLPQTNIPGSFISFAIFFFVFFSRKRNRVSKLRFLFFFFLFLENRREFW